MSIWNRFKQSLGLERSRAEEIEDELASHIAELEERYAAEGIAPSEARRKARAQFGSVARLREETHEQHSFVPLEIMLREFRWALRALRRRPALSFAAVFCLALGIAVTTSLYSVVDAFFLKALPLPEPNQLVALNSRRNGRGTGGNPARLRDIARSVPAIQAAAGFYSEGLIWEQADQPLRVPVLRTFGDVFGVLGAGPNEGRGFTNEENRGHGSVAIATAAFRRKHLNGVALPAEVRLSGKPYRVIGALPESIGYPENIDLIIPADAEMQGDYRGSAFLRDVARVKPGVPLEQVQVQLATLTQQLAQAYPATDSGYQIRARPLQDDETSVVRTPVVAIFAAGVLIFAIATASVSSLLLSRASERTQEAMVRLSLGAGRASLLRLYLLEGLTLALLGGLIGVTLAWHGIDWLKTAVPSDLPMHSRIAMDWRVVQFAVLASVVAGLLCSLSPAWFAARTSQLQVNLRSATAPSRARRWLTGLQVAISAPLLVCAMLLLRSFAAATAIPPGVNPDSTLTISVNYLWDTPASRLRSMEQRILERLAQHPGVRVAGVIDRLPLEGGAQTRPVALRGKPADPQRPQASLRTANPTAFEALGIPLLAGRIFHEDRREVVVNERFVQLFLDGRNPIGESVNLESKADTPVWYEVVGIVGPMRETYGETQPHPQAFTSRKNTYWPLMRYVLRTTQSDPASMMTTVRGELAKLDPLLPIGRIATLEQEIGRSFNEPRTMVSLLTTFAATALLLSMVGLFGLLAADVAQRKREIGIRLALGAAPSAVSRKLLGDGLRVALAGLGIGLIAAFGAARFLESLLFSVKPSDAASFLAVLALTLLGTVAAGWIPARRAATVDAASALRQE